MDARAVLHRPLPGPYIGRRVRTDAVRVPGVLVVGSVLLGGCASPEARAPVVILALDGLEYHILERFSSHLPNLTALLAEGAHAELEVTAPIMSPILWTTMASGYPAEVHGIGGWTSARGRSFTGADVQVERVWDALSAEGRGSVVSGWLMTWPAPIIEGQLLSDRFVWSVPMSREADREGVDAPPAATTFPDALATRAAALVPDQAWLDASPLGYQVKAYGAPSHPLRRDEVHVRVFEALWPESGADFGALYLNGADQVSHIYWPFQDPECQRAIRQDPSAHKRQVDELLARHPTREVPPWGEAGITAADLGEAARWVPDYYAYLDEVVGRVRATIGPDTTLLVVSDHGFQVSPTKPLVDGQHRGTAVFAAVGPRVRPGATAKMHVFDVAPTVYALLGLPAAADMPGQARADLFDLGELPAPGPTRTLERGVIDVGDGASAGDAALRAQLEALGYVDEDGRPNASVGQSRTKMNVVAPAPP